MVGVPNEIEVITRNHEYNWMKSCQTQIMFITLNSLLKEQIISVVRQGHLVVELKLAGTCLF